jgi:copper chaperone CopZ
MNTYQFKTNIKCGGCVANVTPHLDSNKEINEWKVDIASPDKVLTVQTESLDEEQVKKIVEKAGYQASALK